MIYIFASSPERFRECKESLGIESAILIDFTQDISIDENHYFIDFYSPREHILKNIDNPEEYFIQIAENYKKFEREQLLESDLSSLKNKYYTLAARS